MIPTLDRRARLALIGLVSAMVILYWNVIPSMVRDWYIDENYSHGFLIPLISGYLLWTRRAQLFETAKASRRANLVGLVVCLLALGTFLVGRAGAEHFLQRSSLVMMLIGATLWLWGWPLFRVALGPLAFLFFMVPLPYLVYDTVAFPLKLLAARLATVSLSHLGIPVFREGNIIQLPTQTLEVADACSGIRSLVSLIALGIVYAYFTERRLWKRIVIVLATIPIAIAANALRITGTGILSHYVGPEAAKGFFHTFSGWLIFVVALLLLFAVGGLLKLVRRERESA